VIRERLMMIGARVIDGAALAVDLDGTQGPS
jgi:hypothetical protein